MASNHGRKSRAQGLLYLGVDLGTTQLKAGLFDERGSMVASASMGYPTHRRQRNAAEQDGDDWWKALCACCRQLQVDGDGGQNLLKRVAAVCIVGQGPSVVAADGHGNPVRLAVTWADTRCQEEADFLGVFAGYSSLARVMWIARHDPEACAKARWFFQSYDYLPFRLTDQPVTIMSLVGMKPWTPEQIAAAGVKAELFPPRMVPPGELIGHVTAAAAEATGLLEGTPVISGTVDSFSHWVGIDLSEPGRMCDIGGTSEGIAVAVEGPVADQRGRVGCLPNPAGGWVASGAMSNGGSVLQWFRSHFYGDDATYDDILAELAQVPAGAEGVVALPYLRGERVPINDPTARACVFGLGFEHGRAHVGRALLEGVAFGILSVKEIFSEMGIDVRRIVVTGGASRSVLWNQIKADVLGQEVYTPAEPESGILGAAIIARAGVENKPIGAVARGMITLKECYRPDEDRHSLYQQLYMRYLSLYDSLREEYQSLDTLIKQSA